MANRCKFTELTDVANGESINAGTIDLQIDDLTLDTVTAATVSTSGLATVGGLIQKPATSAAINSTATATAAQVATGYITSTSAAATTITMPTGTLLGAELGATAGTSFDLVINNTAGASTVTLAVAVNGILSTAAADTAGSFGDLTTAAGVTGMSRYTLLFASPTAYTITRTA